APYIHGPVRYRGHECERRRQRAMPCIRSEPDRTPVVHFADQATRQRSGWLWSPPIPRLFASALDRPTGPGPGDGASLLATHISSTAACFQRSHQARVPPERPSRWTWPASLSEIGRASCRERGEVGGGA